MGTLSGEVTLPFSFLPSYSVAEGGGINSLRKKFSPPGANYTILKLTSIFAGLCVLGKQKKVVPLCKNGG